MITGVWLLVCLIAIQIAGQGLPDPLPSDGMSIGHIDTFQELELKSNVLIPDKGELTMPMTVDPTAVKVDGALTSKVLNVYTDHADGTFGIGEVLPIAVQFSSPVVVSGVPELKLRTGCNDELCERKETQSIYCRADYGSFSIAFDDDDPVASSFQYVSNNIEWNSDPETVKMRIEALGNVDKVQVTFSSGRSACTSTGNTIFVTFEKVGSNVKQVDGDLPEMRVNRYNEMKTGSQDPLGHVNRNMQVLPLIATEEVKGLRYSNRAAKYVNGSGTDTLVFNYIVQKGDKTNDLDVYDSASINLLTGKPTLGKLVGNESDPELIYTEPCVEGVTDGWGGFIDTIDPVIVRHVGSCELGCTERFTFSELSGHWTAKVDVMSTDIANTESITRTIDQGEGVVEIFFGGMSFGDCMPEERPESDFECAMFECEFGEVDVTNLISESGNLEVSISAVGSRADCADEKGDLVGLYAVVTLRKHRETKFYETPCVIQRDITGRRIIDGAAGGTMGFNRTIHPSISTMPAVHSTIYMAGTEDRTDNAGVPIPVVPNMALPPPETEPDYSANIGGCLSYNNEIKIDVSPPTVMEVDSTTTDGEYYVGELIRIQIFFSSGITVEGSPELELETGDIDRYASFFNNSVLADGRGLLEFEYLVQFGDVTADLNYRSVDALKTNGGTIKRSSTFPTTDADLTLAGAGEAGSLMFNRAISISPNNPKPVLLAPLTPDGTYAAGEEIFLQLSWSTPVSVVNTPTLPLEAGSRDLYPGYGVVEVPCCRGPDFPDGPSRNKMRFPNAEMYLDELNYEDQFLINGQTLTLLEYEPVSRIATFREEWAGPNVTYDQFNDIMVNITLGELHVDDGTGATFQVGDYVYFGDATSVSHQYFSRWHLDMSDSSTGESYRGISGKWSAGVGVAGVRTGNEPDMNTMQVGGVGYDRHGTPDGIYGYERESIVTPGLTSNNLANNGTGIVRGWKQFADNRGGTMLLQVTSTTLPRARDFTIIRHSNLPSLFAEVHELEYRKYDMPQRKGEVGYEPHNSTVYGDLSYETFTYNDMFRMMRNYSYPFYEIRTPHKRQAVYQSGSGTNDLLFKYTVQRGDFTEDLDWLMKQDPDKVTAPVDADWSVEQINLNYSLFGSRYTANLVGEQSGQAVIPPGEGSDCYDNCRKTEGASIKATSSSPTLDALLIPAQDSSPNRGIYESNGLPGRKAMSLLYDIRIYDPVPQVKRVYSTKPGGTYTVGDVIDIQIEFDYPVSVNTNGTGLLLKLRSRTDAPMNHANLTHGNAIYSSGSGTNTLVFVYTVAPDDTTGPQGLFGADGTVAGHGLEYLDSLSLRTNYLDAYGWIRRATFFNSKRGPITNANLTLPWPGITTAESLSGSRQNEPASMIRIDTTSGFGNRLSPAGGLDVSSGGDGHGSGGGAPVVTGVSTPKLSDTYSVGERILVEVNYSAPVFVDASFGTPMIVMATRDDHLHYAHDSEGTTATQQAGDRSHTPSVDFAGLAATSPGDAEAAYVRGSGTSSLLFEYIVGPSDATDVLDYRTARRSFMGPDGSQWRDYTQTTRIHLRGGTINATHGDGNWAQASVVLPTVGGGYSLVGPKNPSYVHDRHLGGGDEAEAFEANELREIKIDTSPPRVQQLRTMTPDGTYGEGQKVVVHVDFSHRVVVSGTPSLHLETGADDAETEYVGGDGTSTLSFLYTVKGGHSSARLDAASETGLICADVRGLNFLFRARDSSQTAAEAEALGAANSYTSSGSSHLYELEYRFSGFSRPLATDGVLGVDDSYGHGAGRYGSISDPTDGLLMPTDPEAYARVGGRTAVLGGGGLRATMYSTWIEEGDWVRDGAEMGPKRGREVRVMRYSGDDRAASWEFVDISPGSHQYLFGEGADAKAAGAAARAEGLGGLKLEREHWSNAVGTPAIAVGGGGQAFVAFGESVGDEDGPGGATHGGAVQLRVATNLGMIIVGLEVVASSSNATDDANCSLGFDFVLDETTGLPLDLNAAGASRGGKKVFLAYKQVEVEYASPEEWEEQAITDIEVLVSSDLTGETDDTKPSPGFTRIGQNLHEAVKRVTGITYTGRDHQQRAWPWEHFYEVSLGPQTFLAYRRGTRDHSRGFATATDARTAFEQDANSPAAARNAFETDRPLARLHLSVAENSTLAEEGVPANFTSTEFDLHSPLATYLATDGHAGPGPIGSIILSFDKALGPWRWLERGARDASVDGVGSKRIGGDSAFDVPENAAYKALPDRLSTSLNFDTRASAANPSMVIFPPAADLYKGTDYSAAEADSIRRSSRMGGVAVPGEKLYIAWEEVHLATDVTDDEEETAFDPLGYKDPSDTSARIDAYARTNATQIHVAVFTQGLGATTQELTHSVKAEYGPKRMVLQPYIHSVFDAPSRVFIDGTGLNSYDPLNQDKDAGMGAFKVGTNGFGINRNPYRSAHKPQIAAWFPNREGSGASSGIKAQYEAKQAAAAADIYATPTPPPSPLTSAEIGKIARGYDHPHHSSLSDIGKWVAPRLLAAWAEYADPLDSETAGATQLRVAMFNNQQGHDNNATWTFIDGDDEPGLNADPLANVTELQLLPIDGVVYAGWIERGHQYDSATSGGGSGGAGQVFIARFDGSLTKLGATAVQLEADHVRCLWPIIGGNITTTTTTTTEIYNITHNLTSSDSISHGYYRGLNRDPNASASSLSLASHDGRLYASWLEPDAANSGVLTQRVSVHTAPQSMRNGYVAYGGDGGICQRTRSVSSESSIEKNSTHTSVNGTIQVVTTTTIDEVGRPHWSDEAPLANHPDYTHTFHYSHLNTAMKEDGGHLYGTWAAKDPPAVRNTTQFGGPSSSAVKPGVYGAQIFALKGSPMAQHTGRTPHSGASDPFHYSFSATGAAANASAEAATAAANGAEPVQAQPLQTSKLYSLWAEPGTDDGTLQLRAASYSGNDDQPKWFSTSDSCVRRLSTSPTLPAAMVLPSPGSVGSLADASAVIVDTEPTVVHAVRLNDDLLLANYFDYAGTGLGFRGSSSESYSNAGSPYTYSSKFSFASLSSSSPSSTSPSSTSGGPGGEGLLSGEHAPAAGDKTAGGVRVGAAAARGRTYGRSGLVQTIDVLAAVTDERYSSAVSAGGYRLRYGEMYTTCIAHDAPADDTESSGDGTSVQEKIQAMGCTQYEVSVGDTCASIARAHTTLAKRIRVKGTGAFCDTLEASRSLTGGDIILACPADMHFFWMNLQVGVSVDSDAFEHAGRRYTVTFTNPSYGVKTFGTFTTGCDAFSPVDAEVILNRDIPMPLQVGLVELQVEFTSPVVVSSSNTPTLELALDDTYGGAATASAVYTRGGTVQYIDVGTRASAAMVSGSYRLEYGANTADATFTECISWDVGDTVGASSLRRRLLDVPAIAAIGVSSVSRTPRGNGYRYRVQFEAGKLLPLTVPLEQWGTDVTDGACAPFATGVQTVDVRSVDGTEITQGGFRLLYGDRNMTAFQGNDPSSYSSGPALKSTGCIQFDAPADGQRGDSVREMIEAELGGGSNVNDGVLKVVVQKDTSAFLHGHRYVITINQTAPAAIAAAGGQRDIPLQPFRVDFAGCYPLQTSGAAAASASFASLAQEADSGTTTHAGVIANADAVAERPPLSTLTFVYEVGADDVASGLTYSSATALQNAGGTIKRHAFSVGGLVSETKMSERGCVNARV
jgi:hypothetical protein